MSVNSLIYYICYIYLLYIFHNTTIGTLLVIISYAIVYTLSYYPIYIKTLMYYCTFYFSHTIMYNIISFALSYGSVMSLLIFLMLITLQDDSD